MPSTLSFLQAASAKCATPSAMSSSNGDLHLLLVEDETKTLAYSLAMDAAYSAASSSPQSCRGCGFSENNACRCCEVAMLVTRRKEVTNNQGRQYQQQHQQQTRNQNYHDTEIPFPLRCYQEVTINKDSNDAAPGEERDQSVLSRIHIKYVHSIQDVIRYLVYSPSLPVHLIPLSGIFLLGLGDLISREHSGGVMELTHVLSLLADTGMMICNNSIASLHSSVTDNDTTTLVATLNQQIYTSLPQTVYKQLGFSIASIQNNAPSTSISELVFEDQSVRTSFSFRNNRNDDHDGIVWSVQDK